jgi:hypothetical protein
MRLSIASLVLVSAVVATAASTQSDRTTEKEVLQALQASDDAAARRDSAAMERLTAEDYIFHASTGIVQTKVQAIVETMAGASTWTVRKYDGLKVRLYGDIAIVTGAFSIAGASSTYRPGPRLITRIFIRRDGRWQDLGGQATLVPSR